VVARLTHLAEPLSLHDALPISSGRSSAACGLGRRAGPPSREMRSMTKKPDGTGVHDPARKGGAHRVWASLRAGLWEPVHGFFSRDRKSTRLNSSHVKNSYADFC